MNIEKNLHLLNNLDNEILDFIKTQLSNKDSIYIGGITNSDDDESLDFLDKDLLNTLPTHVEYENHSASEFVLIGVEKHSDNLITFIGLCQASELYDKDTRGEYYLDEIGQIKALELLSILSKETRLSSDENTLEPLYYVVSNRLQDIDGILECDGIKQVTLYAMVDNKPLVLNSYEFDITDDTQTELNKCIDFGGHDDEDSDEYSKVMSDYINGRTSNSFELKVL